MENVKKLTDWIPAQARAVVYAALGALIAIETIWDFLPDVLEGKLLKTLSVLGFGMAFTQTPIMPGE